MLLWYVTFSNSKLLIEFSSNGKICIHTVNGTDVSFTYNFEL